MKKSYLMTGLLLLLSASSWALVPPKYLSVPDWQSCVGKMTKGSAEFICLPAKKPDYCSETSWQSLVALHEIDRCLLVTQKSKSIKHTATSY